MFQNVIFPMIGSPTIQNAVSAGNSQQPRLLGMNIPMLAIYVHADMKVKQTLERTMASCLGGLTGLPDGGS